MATYSGVVRFKSNNALAPGARVRLKRTDVTPFEVVGDVLADATTAEFEFTDVDDAWTVALDVEFDDGAGQLYNALNLPFLQGGFNPATLNPNIWVKADESDLFTLRDDSGTLYVTSTGAKSPATIALTQATEANQPTLDDNLIKFTKADQTGLIGPSGSGEFMSGPNAQYTVSIAVPKWGTTGGVVDDNSTMITNTTASSRFRITQSGGDLTVSTGNGQTLATTTRTGAKIITVRVDHEAGVASVLINNDTIINITDIEADTAFSGLALRLGFRSVGNLHSVMDFAELITIPSYVDADTFAALHSYSMRHFPS